MMAKEKELSDIQISWYYNKILEFPAFANDLKFVQLLQLLKYAGTMRKTAFEFIQQLIAEKFSDYDYPSEYLPNKKFEYWAERTSKYQESKHVHNIIINRLVETKKGKKFFKPIGDEYAAFSKEAISQNFESNTRDDLIQILESIGESRDKYLEAPSHIELVALKISESLQCLAENKTDDNKRNMEDVFNKISEERNRINEIARKYDENVNFVVRTKENILQINEELKYYKTIISQIDGILISILEKIIVVSSNDITEEHFIDFARKHVKKSEALSDLVENFDIDKRESDLEKTNQLGGQGGVLLRIYQMCYEKKTKDLLTGAMSKDDIESIAKAYDCTRTVNKLHKWWNDYRKENGRRDLTDTVSKLNRKIKLFEKVSEYLMEDQKRLILEDIAYLKNEGRKEHVRKF